MSNFTPNEKQYDYDTNYALTHSGSVQCDEMVTPDTGVQVIMQKIEDCFIYEVHPFECYSGSSISPPIFTLSEKEAEFQRKMAKIQCLFLDAPLGIDYNFKN
jgi:hypothetical protein